LSWKVEGLRVKISHGVTPCLIFWTGLAAVLPGGPLADGSLAGKNVVVPLCGGNIDTTVLGRVLERGLAADGRCELAIWFMKLLMRSGSGL
jgi:hypothetical protein